MEKARKRKKRCLREESERRRGRRGRRGKDARDGRAKNRQRPGRKEGAENEGELRSASESPEASRSALSRWISSGQHRSLSFSLSPSFWLAPSTTLLSLSLSLGPEGGEDDEARRYLLSFPRPQRNDRIVPPPHHFTVGCRVPRERLPPGAQLSRTTIGMKAKRRKEGRPRSFFFFSHVAAPRRDPAPSPAGQPKRLAYTYIHILICTHVWGPCIARVHAGRRAGTRGTITSPVFASLAAGLRHHLLLLSLLLLLELRILLA